MLDSSINSIKVDFVNELREYIPALTEIIGRLKEDKKNHNGLKELHRLVHTIKGAASLVKLNDLSQMASKMEVLLENVIDQRIVLNDKAFTALVKATCFFDSFTKSFSSETDDIQNTYSAAVAHLEEILGNDMQEPHEYDKPLPDSNGIPQSPKPVFSSDDIVLDEFELPADDICADEDDLPEISPNEFPEAMLPEEDGSWETNDHEDQRCTTPLVSEEKSAGNSDPLQQELLEGFYQEAEDHLTDLNDALRHLEGSIKAKVGLTDDHKELLRKIRRSVHTIKGAAAVIKLSSIAAWGHAFEDLLDWLYEEAATIDPSVVQLISEATDIFELHISAPEKIDADRANAIKADFRRTIGSDSRAEPEDEADSLDPAFFTDHTRPASGSSNPNDTARPDMSASEKASALPGKQAGTLRVDIRKVETLVNLASELIIALSAFDRKMVGLGNVIGELDSSRVRLRDTARDLEVGYEVKAIQHLGSHPNKIHPPLTATEDGQQSFHDFDLLELDRYSEFNLIIRSLNETSVDVGTISNQLTDIHGGFESYLNRLRTLLSELQDKVMRVRMTPMSLILNRLRHTVRETAAQLNKPVRFRVKGEHIELDKMVWEKLADPLMHLLRNAVDHGIEPQEKRIANGKPADATIQLTAAYQGNQVILQVSDDGAGLDYDAIRRAAQKIGLSRDAAAMTEDELSALIFYPGFSTRSDISEVSGRGIGLDVVKENISQLKGAVKVEKAVPGRGTTFRIRIPLTLAVMRALLFTVEGRLFATALHEIKEILRAQPEQIIMGEANALKIKDRIWPLYYLSEALTHNTPYPESTSSGQPPLVFIIDTGSWRGAVIVDSIYSQKEIVIKSLGSHLRHVQGISGATVMGDGQVVPIVNFEELYSLPTALKPIISREGKEPLGRALKIMVIDDSVSVRTVVSRLMERQGWDVRTAKDGIEALDFLPVYSPDLIVLDIEMPRMNGYEFMSALRAQALYQKIPVIMLTSRTAKKHRKKARALGVNDFVVKPYEDDEFIALVKRYTGPNRHRWLENDDI